MNRTGCTSATRCLRRAARWSRWEWRISWCSTPARVAVDVDRGPLLILAGGRNRAVPPASSRSVARRYESAQGITEYREFEDRGHSLVVDAGWPEIADYVLGWLAFQSIHGA